MTRDGPLEKLWGEGNFQAAGIFFRYQIPCMNFLEAIAWIFFRINWHAWNFFHLIFPCANIFFWTSPPPPPDKFSNGPSLSKLYTIISNELSDLSLYFWDLYNRWVITSQQKALGPYKCARFRAKQTYRNYSFSYLLTFVSV